MNLSDPSRPEMKRSFGYSRRPGRRKRPAGRSFFLGKLEDVEFSRVRENQSAVFRMVYMRKIFQSLGTIYYTKFQ